VGFTITIIGMGLMGASLAMALPGFKNARIIGINRSKTPLEAALASKIIDEGFLLDDAAVQRVLAETDLTVICLFPQLTIEIMKRFSSDFKPGSVVTDVVGVKQAVIDSAHESLPESVDFVGAHPMAGVEASGYDAAFPALYQGCNYILTPMPWNKPESVQLVRDMALHAGAGKITIATPEQQDRMIAYTSQMAHVLAAAIMRSPHLMESKGFEGSSFRDVTRVATLQPALWSELFLLNRQALVPVLERLEDDLAALRKMIERNNRAALVAELTQTSNLKESWNNFVEEKEWRS
jgi:prephenate dehydrogenase